MESYIQYSFEMSELERQHNCLKTIINILITRKWIDDDFDKIFDSIKKNEVTDIVIIPSNYKNIQNFVIKFYHNKLNTIKNDKDIDSFLVNNTKNHKILIVTEFSIKAEKQIDEINNFEIFKINDVIRNISEHHSVPKHILLSKEDGLKVMEEYNFMKKDMGRIYKDDPMAKYLYAQVDDIVQIIRYSVVSGYSTYYRLVVPGSIYN